MTRKGWVITRVFILLALLPLVPCRFAALEERPENIDPKVKQVLQQAEEYIKSLNSLRVKIDIILIMEAEGMKQEMTSSYTLALQRPNKLAMVLEKGMIGGTLICDGKDVYVYNPMTKRYTKKEAPESLKDMDVSSLIGGMEGTGMGIVEFFIRDNLYDTLKAKVTGAQYVGEEELDGIKYNHLKFLTKDADFDVWVQGGEKSIPYKIVPDMTKSLKKAGEALAATKGMKFDIKLVFKNWEGNAELPKNTFMFTPPENAKAEEPAEPHPLLGTAAPPFKLQMLEGGEFDLSGQKGKNIIILDFWATWCGPCRKVMPTMEEVAGEYKDKGVLLIGVNLQESVEKIQSFLLELGLHPAVALDKDGKVGKLYEAKAIPQTVIIDKDGSVQAVHVGATPDLKEVLKKELDDLLAGKKLVSELYSQSAKQKKALKDIVVISTALSDYITDNGLAPKQAGIYDATMGSPKALSPFYVKVLPIEDPWGNNYRVYCGTACNGIYGISGCGPKDFIVISFGADGKEEAWKFDPSNKEAGLIEIKTLSDFNIDLVIWNGHWIRGPKIAEIK